MNETSARIIGDGRHVSKKSATPTHNARSVVNDKPTFYEDKHQTCMLKRKVITCGVCVLQTFTEP